MAEQLEQRLEIAHLLGLRLSDAYCCSSCNTQRSSTSLSEGRRNDTWFSTTSAPSLSRHADTSASPRNARRSASSGASSGTHSPHTAGCVAENVARTHPRIVSKRHRTVRASPARDAIDARSREAAAAPSAAAVDSIR
eukprot:238979-Chlamydomonas_euryale.AAC.1